jgi:methylmalonyl-CoA mutase
MAEPQSQHPAGDAPSMDAWRRLAEQALKDRSVSAPQSRTRDGIVIEPLYVRRADTVPVLGRGAKPWTLIQVIDNPDLDRSNAQALEDLLGGATGLALRFAGAPSAAGFGLPPTAEALHGALEDVDLAAVHLRIDPHRQAIGTARLLQDLIARSGVAPERADAAFGLDPIGPAAFQGSAVPDPDSYVACFRELQSAGLYGPIAELDARVFHEAGASEAQELAAVLAGAVWWLRALGSAGTSPTAALPFFGATLSVDRDQFLSIAKLRAVRLLWARLQELCGAPLTPLRLHAETSRRMMTRADAHGNLLRTTIAALSASVGGADSIAVLPHTTALGLADSNARALARNLQHLLMEESHLHRVAHPAAGSGALEALTDALAERAWAEFQAIEREGGVAESLRFGAFPSRIASARDALGAALRRGEAPLVGVTIYQAPGEARPRDMPVEPLMHPTAGFAPIRLEELAAA